MDPKKQECIGHYLYGAGYYARDENTLSIVTGQSRPPHFCLTCIRVEDCENQHEQRVRELLPEEAETFDRLMAEARGRDIPPTIAATYIASRGLDPFQRVAVDNFAQGHAERGLTAGPLTK